MEQTAKPQWPDLPLAAWSEACDTLHLWTQIVGKVRIALTPLVNHWWNCTLYVTSRGLVAPAMPYQGRTLDIAFDFLTHRLLIETSDGGSEEIALKPMTVADFYAAFMAALRRLDIDVHIWTMPGEIENAIPFEKDKTHAQYDPVYAQRFWRTLVRAHRVMTEFRARFLGKASPVHFFWGSFDLVVTRFSGRPAPPPQSVTPNVAAWVMAEAYSRECSSCGFWPGNGGYGRAAFYVYAYPEPKGYGDARLTTAGAFYDKKIGQFILPYDAMRQASDPDALLLGFLQETYAAAADLAQWDRKALERSEATARR
ncbi:MAG TPA: DUF5996 family protein [Xanthobacteraceae bacterium]|jgi:hypothetical protein|nr:DUF5996 family protein [Xanthobacteraceae bacterium]